MSIYKELTVSLSLKENGSHRRGKKVYQKIMETHSDQAIFEQNKRASIHDDDYNNWRIMVIIPKKGKMRGPRQAFNDHATPKQVEQAMSQVCEEANRTNFEKRLLREPGQDPQKEIQEIKEENQELREQVSQLQSQISENTETVEDLSDKIDQTTEQVNQNTEEIEATKEKTDRMIDSFTESQEQIIEQLDQLEEKIESQEEDPENIKNRHG